VTTHFEDIIRQNSERLADLKKTTEELQRELSEARVSLERELARPTHGRPAQLQAAHPGAAHLHADYGHAVHGHDVLTDQIPVYPGPPEEMIPGPGAVPPQRHYAGRNPLYYSADEPPFAGDAPRFGHEGRWSAGEGEWVAGGGPRFPSGDWASAADEAAGDVPDGDPTVGIASHGRQSAYRRGLSRRTIMALGGAGVVLATVLAVIITSGGASWPASVARVQAQVVKACQNPDVVSEPGQVNFACAKATRQILWVFALLTSNDNSHFADTRTGRQGLEPITPSQGGAVAASLNLHHPYDPANPIDSIAVAARAINDIIGGATLTGTNGNPVVQPGLESDSRNCLRYTGSGLVTSRQGFPDLCARPVAGSQGQRELVADIYKKWIVGASAGAANDAAVLFANADNPGNPQVQAILRQLGNETLAA
jgi:hypothetical protein